MKMEKLKIQLYSVVLAGGVMRRPYESSGKPTLNRVCREVARFAYATPYRCFLYFDKNNRLKVVVVMQKPQMSDQRMGFFAFIDYLSV